MDSDEGLPPTRTAAAPAEVPRREPTASRFAPGTVLAGRYRIVSALGRGGMGEVFRADDLKLGQPVALKFLPAAFASDPARLGQLVDEVRVGRQISHPNVCRLYDIAEAEGQHFLVMEFVDGEDLASLLRRIGGLSGDKALELARDVCAGLAAAHDRGVIHRDLKPANVMIDDLGHARIADFGLAALADGKAAGDFSGTPAYMAPEQLVSGGASLRSDVYALGLVLYEMLAGQKAFEAKSLDELRALQAAARPASLSGRGKDVDPGLERAVLRCLEPDPDERPANARVVLALLPGGDPLQAAILAGETPSPEMVAASAKVGDLAPPVAWACLLSGLAGLALVTALAGTTKLVGSLRPTKGPDVLAERARDVLIRIGYTEPAVDSAWAFDLDSSSLAYLREGDPAPNLAGFAGTARPGPLRFWYRQSPEPLAARRTPTLGQVEVGRILREDPPPTVPGMVAVELDRRGALVRLHAVPAADAAAAPAREPDWTALLEAAELDATALVPAAPRSTSPADSDRKAAWEGAYADQPGVVLHVEAAALRGRPVWFEIQSPWARPASPHRAVMRSVVVWTIVLILALVLATIGVVVRRNLRLGRGDRKGGARLATAVGTGLTVALLLRADHVASVALEPGLVVAILSIALFNATTIWAYYLAIEPIARRRMPELLISWTRLLAGHLRDPLVGRDALLGCLAGVALSLVVQLAYAVPVWLGFAPSPLRGHVVTTLGGVRHLVYFTLFYLVGAVAFALSSVLVLFLLRSVLRRRSLALGVLFGFLYVALLSPAVIDSDTFWSPAAFFFTALWIVVLLRLGLLASMVSLFVFLMLEATPLTVASSSWYFGQTLACHALLAGLLGYGFVVSLAGKPAFGRPILEGEGSN